MAKKKNNGLGKILSFVALALGVVALCMIFVTVGATPDKTTLGVTVEGIKVSGLKAAFGYSEEDVANLAFSFMSQVIRTILAYFFKKSQLRGSAC